MTRGKLLAVAALGMFGLVAGSLPAAAAAEPPPVIQIEDPLGDANGLNDQGTGSGDGDHVTPVDAGSTTDLMAVWFTNDAVNLSVGIQTQVAPATEPGAVFAPMYRVRANPDDGGAACLFFEAYFPGNANSLDKPLGLLRDVCTEGAEPVEGTVVVETGPEDTGIITITFSRSDNAAFGAGKTIAAPRAETRLNWFNAQPGPTSPSLNFPQIDNTKTGTDYVIVDSKKKKKR